MASLSDVLSVLETITTNAVYPDGTSSASVAGVDVAMMQGWPVRTVLDTQLKAGKAAVSLFSTTKEKIVTKFLRDWDAIQKTPATLTALISGNHITLGGTVSVPQAVMVLMNDVGYGYQVLMTDTLTTIATALAALIPGASSVGSVITITGNPDLMVRFATNYTAGQELSRQERVIMVTIWAPSPGIRDVLEDAIDQAMKINYKPSMPDGYYAMIFPESDPGFIDSLEKSLVFRRDLHYRVQYATTNVQTYTAVTDPFVNLVTSS